MTGRSLVEPSPLLSTPVVALNGRADASELDVPGYRVRDSIARGDDCAMALVDNARPALFFTELIEVVRTETVAVRFGRVGGLRQCVADRCERVRMLPAHQPSGARRSPRRPDSRPR